ncbi:MAG: phage tail sheath family protein [Lachnospiraceae bacterium]|jgi:phage tail sheath protein FI|nr:phage tail sheath family protein [Lachnospiraceae bacterium]
MAYKHGVEIIENPTSLTAPLLGTAAFQVVVGVSPVNLAEDPYNATNVVKLAYSLAEASTAVGYSKNLKDYNLNQSISASFTKFAVAPIALINVLDPKKHKDTIAKKSYPVEALQVMVDIEGILRDTLIVESGESALQPEVDYIVNFNNDGYVIITLLEDGAGKDATELNISGDKIDPSKVTRDDIIGGYNVSTGKESGLELVRQVYPLFGLTPGLITSPGYSKDPVVASVMAAKCLKINGVFTCECIVDLDSTEDGATKYTDIKTVKEHSGLISEHMEPVWPKVRIGDEVYYYSAVYAALIAYMDAGNDDVPNLYASNKALPITGLCLDDEDDSEIVIDQEQANVINSFGVVTALNFNGFRSWGNNSAAYPMTTDPKDRWFCCRRFFSWWGNSFILSYFQRVDDPANSRLIQSICDAENIRGNSYVAQGKCAGARITYSEDENPITDILNGKIQFHQYLAQYTPAENILNILEFDPTMLEAALGGE